MLQPSDLHIGWPSALRALAQSATPERGDDNPGQDPIADDSDDAEREPFHLDDTELAKRLVRDRGLIHYSTPPRARPLFQDMVQP